MTTGREFHIFLPDGPSQPRKLLDQITKFTSDPTNPNRWLAGVRWQPERCRALSVDDVDACVGVDQTVDAIECLGWASQLPFRISDALVGSTLEYTADELQTMSTEFYLSALSAAFATELVSGVGSGGESLSSVATAPVGAAFGAAATPIWNALAILEEEIASRLQGEVGFIFLQPGLLAQAVRSYGLRLNGDRWETPAGNIVISDAGFILAAPPTGETTSGAGEDWVYASGPVSYQESEPRPIGSGSESLDKTRNTITQYVNGFGILVFDPCPVTAILASYALEG